MRLRLFGPLGRPVFLILGRVELLEHFVGSHAVVAEATELVDFHLDVWISAIIELVIFIIIYLFRRVGVIGPLFR